MLSSILVPLDGSELAERALPYATALAHRAEGRLLLPRAVQTHTLPGADPGPAWAVATERANAALHALAERLKGDGLQVGPHVSEDDAAHAILDAAGRQHAGLVVMSTHGRTGLGRWVYGSVADEVLRHAPCPVLLVPARESTPPRT